MTHRKELTASTEIVDLLGEQSRKIEELQGLLKHAAKYMSHDVSKQEGMCDLCAKIAKEIGQ